MRTTPQVRLALRYLDKYYGNLRYALCNIKYILLQNLRSDRHTTKRALALRAYVRMCSEQETIINRRECEIYVYRENTFQPAVVLDRLLLEEK